MRKPRVVHLTAVNAWRIGGLFLLLLNAGMMALGQESKAIVPDGVKEKVEPQKLVVLTFDDSAKSHFTVARPLLLKYGFGATFFITEGWDFATNKRDYMTWEEIRQLDRDGFEIGNHTRDHLAITDESYEQLDEQLKGIEKRCAEYGIAKPVSFAWPGNARTEKAFPELKKHGIRYARRGGEPEFPYQGGRGVAYQVGKFDELLLPSAGDARPNWELEDFVRAVSQAEDGKIAILQFHGVPDTAHSWVSSPTEKFEIYLRYLATHGFRVIALRDIAKHFPANVPSK
jgi:peptidoglycan-N-acetylglucosamine deacetylase